MAAAELTQFRVRRLEAALVAVDGGNPGAGPGQTDGHGAADAAAPACNNADPARQAEPIG